MNRMMKVQLSHRIREVKVVKLKSSKRTILKRKMMINLSLKKVLAMEVLMLRMMLMSFKK